MINEQSRRPTRKRIRLDREAYAQPDATWLISIAVSDRPARPFVDRALAKTVLDSMIESSQGRLDVFAAVVMPDHAHLLVALASGNLIDHISAVKSATTRVWWKHGGSGVLWQRSFHDKGILNASIFERALEYVVNHPVEAGMVAHWFDYPHIAGSMIETSS